jgi:hypothetical protein
MGASENRNKNSKMAAELVKQGYPHGRRKSNPTMPTWPSMKDVGSAAYRRLRGLLKDEG